MSTLLKKFVAAFAVCALAMCMLAACDSSSNSNAPQNLTFDQNTGNFSFDAVEGADTYIVGVSKVLNDATGTALASINGSAQLELESGETVYLWSEQAGSASGLADSDGDGTVEGTVVFREYSSSATTVGAVITMDQLPLGRYIVQAVPAATDALPNPEPAIVEFVKGGTLATPSGFTAQINDAGNMEITAPSDYYLNCLTATGLPTKMVFEISDESGVVETIEMDDFSYTNTVNGPNKMFTFNNGTVTGTTQLDTSKTYNVTVTAVGDGATIQDASANVYTASNTAALSFASTYDTKGNGSAAGATLAVTLGTDASGANVYELTATINNMVVRRESGTFTASAAAGSYNDKYTFPEGATITFSTSASDLDTPVLDGLTCSVVSAETMAMPWDPNGGGTNYYLSGNATFDGEAFEFTTSSGGGGMFPGGPM